MDAHELEARFTDRLERHSQQFTLRLNGLILVFCLLLGCWNFYQAQSIPRYTDIFDQMLGGKSLPALSNTVIRLAAPCFALAITLPWVAVGVFFALGRKPHSTWIMLGVLLVIGLQLLATRAALWLPLRSIITEMSSP